MKLAVGRKALAILGAGLLLGCAGAAGEWVKPGTDTGAAGRAYSECRGEAEDAVRTDVAIDRDILATRSRDWQSAGTLRHESQVMHDQTADRRRAIFEACMRAQGFRRQG